MNQLSVMKKVFLLLIGFALISNAKSFCQEINGVTRMTATNFQTITHPLILVDGMETDLESMVLLPDHIETITILKGQSATDKYGDKAKDGTILITTKPGTQFYKITDFVDASKNLNKNVTKIQLNGKLLIANNKLLIDKTAFPITMISSNWNLNNDCNPSSIDTLVISTQFADKK